MAEDARRGAAALALVEEEPQLGDVDGGVEVGALVDDERAFTSKLERHARHVRLLGRLAEDGVPHLGVVGASSRIFKAKT